MYLKLTVCAGAEALTTLEYGSLGDALKLLKILRDNTKEDINLQTHLEESIYKLENLSSTKTRIVKKVVCEECGEGEGELRMRVFQGANGKLRYFHKTCLLTNGD